MVLRCSYIGDTLKVPKPYGNTATRTGGLYISKRQTRTGEARGRTAERSFTVENEHVEQETNENQAEAQELTVEEQLEKTKAESRKWEKRAKENAEAAAELAQLKEAQLSEQEKLTKRAEDAESELAQLKAEADRLTAAAEVAKETNTPVDLLAFCASRDSMEAFAKVYADHMPTVHSAPSAPSSRPTTGKTPKTSNRDAFAAMAAERFATRK